MKLAAVASVKASREIVAVAVELVMLIEDPVVAIIYLYLFSFLSFNFFLFYFHSSYIVAVCLRLSI